MRGRMLLRCLCPVKVRYYIKCNPHSLMSQYSTSSQGESGGDDNNTNTQHSKLSTAAKAYLQSHIDEYKAVYPDVLATNANNNVTNVATNSENIRSVSYQQHHDGVLKQRWKEFVSERLVEIYGDDRDENYKESEWSDIGCSGCGAMLQCADRHQPGFLNISDYRHYKRTQRLRNTKCLRCQLLNEYHVALKAEVSEEVYRQILADIRHKHCLLLILVDLLDMPCSLYDDLHTEIGAKHKSIFLVGNKVDLLPVDSSFYLDNVKESLMKCVEAYTGLVSHHIQHVELISAKTGYGIEPLIDKIFTLWGSQGDIYILGSTNVGKSSLFNQLLNSDLCSTEESNIIDDAVVSIWPGTTLNTLKFPLMAVNDHLRGWRHSRRMSDVAAERRDWKWMSEGAARLSRVLSPTHQGEVRRTFEKYHPYPQLDPILTEKADPFRYNVNDGKVAPAEDKLAMKTVFNPNKWHLADASWLYDTPGFITDKQMGDILTTRELSLLYSDTTIYPRIFSLSPGTSILVAGLARIDYRDVTQNSGNGRGNTSSLYVSVFTGSRVPVHCLNTNNVHAFYAKHEGTSFLKIPENNEERLKKFPKLQSKRVTVTGIGFDRSAADITFSTGGWFCVTAHEGQQVECDVSTPAAVGIYVRSPPLLAHTTVNMMGARIARSREHRVNRLDVTHYAQIDGG